jgi:hypothetical protein
MLNLLFSIKMYKRRKRYKWKMRKAKGLDTFTKKKERESEKDAKENKPRPECILHKKGELKQTKTSIKTKKETLLF